MNRDAVYYATDRLFSHWYGDAMKFGGQGCLYWMHCGLCAFAQAGVDTAVPQAGSAQWQMLPEDKDDGVSPTHFAHQWGGPPEGAIHAPIRPGIIPLPEMHCWIGLKDSHEIVDFSTGYIQRMAEACGFVWKAPPLPPYIWAKADSLPAYASYIPNERATMLAINRMIGSATAKG